jgi:precorrin-4/cobalt-precorrin-4 C11-methyltransferase
VYFIGAGPGDPELLTVKGRRLIAEADLVLYAGSLVPEAVVASARAGAELASTASMDLEATHARITEAVAAGRRVVRVHTGDPSLFGAVREQIHLLQEAGIACEIVPGVSAAMAAAARAGVVFTVPEATQTLICTRLAGRTPVPEAERLEALARHGCSLAVYLSTDKAAEARAQLLAAGLAPDTLVVIGCRVGHPEEVVVRTSIAEMAEAVAEHGIDRQAVFLVLPAEEAGQPSRSRLYDKRFSHGFRDAEE